MTKELKSLVILFGATGDLARRKLYAAFYRLYKKGYLKEHFAVIGTARREWSDDYFRDIVLEGIADEVTDPEEAARFASHFYYQSHDVNDTAHYVALSKLADSLDDRYDLEGNRLFYLSMNPSFFGSIARHLKSEKLANGQGINRVIIEKPFGHDYQSAKALNDEIAAYFSEDQIFRIDHYLGKEMIRNIMSVRMGNPVLRESWNADFIDNVQITLAEDMGIEERGGYYDESGALRDMVQNHILQVVALIAMEEPIEGDNESLRLEKNKVLRNLKLLSHEEVKENYVRGQYMGDPEKGINGYRQENMVADDSQTETFVAGKITIETDRWKDTPFYIRTGKRMSSKTTRVDIIFKAAPNDTSSSNVLSFNIAPEEGFTYSLNAKSFDPNLLYQPVDLTYQFDHEQTDASLGDYESLILDALVGNSAYFVHWDELEASWKYVDRIREVWDQEEPEFPNYLAGSDGPYQAYELLAKNQDHWLDI